jgi:hypothetical protein
MSDLKLVFNNEHVNLDSCLDIIFGLDQITTLYLIWEGMSVDKIKFALKKQIVMNRCEYFGLGRVDQEMNDHNILEICSYLSNLYYWVVISPRTTITIDGAREWKRICPNLQTVILERGEGLSEEVKEILLGLGVNVINSR